MQIFLCDHSVLGRIAREDGASNVGREDIGAALGREAGEGIYGHVPHTCAVAIQVSAAKQLQVIGRNAPVYRRSWLERKMRQAGQLEKVIYNVRDLSLFEHANAHLVDAEQIAPGLEHVEIV